MCPSAVTNLGLYSGSQFGQNPLAGFGNSYSGVCIAGAACSTRFNSQGSGNLIGTNIQSIQGLQEAYLKERGISNNFQVKNAALNDIFKNSCGLGPPANTTTTTPLVVSTTKTASQVKKVQKDGFSYFTIEFGSFAAASSQSDDNEVEGSDDGEYEVIQYNGDRRELQTVTNGSECFLSLCLNGGPENFYFNFKLNKVPFQREIVELCRCITKGGTACNKACGCKQGRPTAVLGGGTSFCSCYCSCC